MTLPPLELTVNVMNPGGVTYRWDPNDPVAGNRPQGLSFSTKRGDGFAEASVTLARRIDQDYVDLSLFDDVAFVGADGSVAYEGRVAAQPRSFQGTHSISVQMAGWMSHARDQPFTMVFVDRDMGSWGQISAPRRVTQVATNGAQCIDSQVSQDTNSSFPALVFPFQGDYANPDSEAVYDAGAGNLISSMYFDAVTNNLNAVANPAWVLVYGFVANDSIPGAGHSSDISPSLPLAQYVAATSVAAGPTRYVHWEGNYAGSGTFSAEFHVRRVALYGNHGIPVRSTLGDPGGLFASDVIRYIANTYCPELSVAGVLDTNYPIPHLVFKDPTDPFDAFTAINAFHLWELGVWENKTLTFAPSDRTVYDWEVRLSDFGVDVDLQGDSVEDLANGIIVRYQNVQTGASDTLRPDTTPALADASPESPVNTHGLKRWTTISLSAPTTADAATQIGRAALAEFNAPKAPGSITITGHLRDRAGHWNQAWKVRAGDTIAITDHPNDSPRLITETSWNHDSKQLTVTVDSTAKRLDALLDRLGVAMTAAGLSSG